MTLDDPGIWNVPGLAPVCNHGEEVDEQCVCVFQHNCNDGILYFFHSDHLGTSTFLTDATGEPYQFFLNLPFGETMEEQFSLSPRWWGTPYLFNGKELDSRTNLYYYGARYYDPGISGWLSVDPLAEKYAGWSSYAFTMNNPINLIDPDGRGVKGKDDIIIWYIDDKGNDASFTFNGNNTSEAPNNAFVCDVINAYNYNTGNGGGDKLKAAATNPEIQINLVETSGDNMSVKLTQKGHSREFVYWNVGEGLQVENGDILSPATILEHEIDHSYERLTNKNYYKNKMELTTPFIRKNYDNYEEYRTISGSETKTAKANGEIKKSKGQSRYSHNSNKLKSVKVIGPTSNKLKY